MATSAMVQPAATHAAIAVGQRGTQWWLPVCGILSALLYIAMNAIIPMRYEGYDIAAQTVSELSAIGAPTRALWVPLGVVYALLVTAFGVGVWQSAGQDRRLRLAGAVVALNGVLSLYWPPMHMRGELGTLTDTLHIAWSIVTVLLMLAALVIAAKAFGTRFRLFTIATLVVVLLFGALTGMDGPRIAANLPTPWIGIWERVSIGAYMLWTLVFAGAILRNRR